MKQFTPSTENLKQFKPLDQLSEKELILLTAHAVVASFEAGQLIFSIGSHDQLEYFLCEGTVELCAEDGRTKQISAGSDSARNAIALLQPRKFDVKAIKDCTFVCIKQSLVNAALSEAPKDQEVIFTVSDVHSGQELQSISDSFQSDLANNNLQLPSFPDTALKIRSLVDDENSTVKDLAEALINDPAMTAKILKACNSPLYRTETEITSCQQAVVRLGFNTTRQLVTVFAMKELFKTKNKFLQTKMAELWDHSREVAAISYVLAKMTPGLDPELSMLSGLLQDIGTVPVLHYLEKFPQFMKLDSKVEEICQKLKKDIGGTMLKHWGMHDHLIEVATHSEDWFHKNDDLRASYVDVAIIAQLHSYIGKKNYPLPSFADIPAFAKIGDGGLTPETSQKILLESKHQIDEIKSLLGAPSIPVLT